MTAVQWMLQIKPACEARQMEVQYGFVTDDAAVHAVEGEVS